METRLECHKQTLEAARRIQDAGQLTSRRQNSKDNTLHWNLKCAKVYYNFYGNIISLSKITLFLPKISKLRLISKISLVLIDLA